MDRESSGLLRIGNPLSNSILIKEGPGSAHWEPLLPGLLRPLHTGEAHISQAGHRAKEWGELLSATEQRSGETRLTLPQE